MRKFIKLTVLKTNERHGLERGDSINILSDDGKVILEKEPSGLTPDKVTATINGIEFMLPKRYIRMPI